MPTHSDSDKLILQNEFGDNRWLDGFFVANGQRTRRFAIVIHISGIGRHRPFGYVISRSLDRDAPKEELSFRSLVGRTKVELHGSLRVGEQAQLISKSVHIHSATGKELGEFDAPPLMTFSMDEVHDTIDLPANDQHGRYAQYFFCAPSDVWPGMSGHPYALEADGKFFRDDQGFSYCTKDGLLRVTARLWARYKNDDFNEIGPEFFKRPIAQQTSIGEQSTKLIINAPQPTVLVELLDHAFSDKEFEVLHHRTVQLLKYGFSFLCGARCYWHSRETQSQTQHRETHTYNGDWNAKVPFGPLNYPINDLSGRSHDCLDRFFCHLVETASAKQMPRELPRTVDAYLSCLLPGNRRDCFTLACLLLEELSKNHKHWLISKSDWKEFLEDVETRFPALITSKSVRSSLSFIAQSKFSARLESWALENKLDHEDLGSDPFISIVRCRNRVVHNLDAPPTEDEIGLELARALTLIERYILKKLDWSQTKPIREDADRAISQANRAQTL